MVTDRRSIAGGLLGVFWFDSFSVEEKEIGN